MPQVTTTTCYTITSTSKKGEESSCSDDDHDPAAKDLRSSGSAMIRDVRKVAGTRHREAALQKAVVNVQHTVQKQLTKFTDGTMNIIGPGDCGRNWRKRPTPPPPVGRDDVPKICSCHRFVIRPPPRLSQPPPLKSARQLPESDDNEFSSVQNIPSTPIRIPSTQSDMAVFKTLPAPNPVSSGVFTVNEVVTTLLFLIIVPLLLAYFLQGHFNNCCGGGCDEEPKTTS